jgi:hypothetical protein
VTPRAVMCAVSLVSLIGVATMNPEHARAQSLSSGVRVRVGVRNRGLETQASERPRTAVAPKRDWLVGRFVEVQRESLFVTTHRAPLVLGIPIASVRRLEVSLGRKSRAGKGALIGMAVGAAAGVAAALVVCANGNCETSGIDNEKSVVAFAFGLGGGLFGAGTGAVAGAVLRSERWERVVLP